MTERPILMHARSINGILENLKSQTRRIMKPQPEIAAGMNCTRLRLKNRKGEEFVDVALEAQNFQDVVYSMCPYGQPGDRLWVKESHYLFGHWRRDGKTKTGKPKYRFVADRSNGVQFEKPDSLCHYKTETGWFKRNSLFMPRWASRLTLEVTGIRVERVQDISIADARAEGIPEYIHGYRTDYTEREADIWRNRSSAENFAELWDDTNGEGAWHRNDWCWVVDFKRIQQ